MLVRKTGSVSGHLVHLAKFLMLRFLKKILLPQISSSFHQTLGKACKHGKYSSLLFGAICKYDTLMKIRYLSCFTIIHKNIYLFSPGKRSSRSSRGLDLLLFMYFLWWWWWWWWWGVPLRHFFILFSLIVHTSSSGPDHPVIYRNVCYCITLYVSSKHKLDLPRYMYWVCTMEYQRSNHHTWKYVKNLLSLLHFVLKCFTDMGIFHNNVALR